MTTVDRTTTRRRRYPTSPRGTAASRIRLAWNIVWLLVVPLLVAFWVDQQIGAGWGSIPAFWAPGDPKPAGPNIAGALAVVAAVLICVVMHRKQVDLQLGLLPIVGAVAVYLAGSPGWIGAIAGLVVGVIWLFVRSRQGR